MNQLKIPDPTLPSDIQQGYVPKPIVVFDESEAFSVVNMVTDKVAEAIKAVPEEWHAMSERELRAKVTITHTDNALRVSFWREYERAVGEGKNHIASRWIFSGICTEQYFYKFLKNPKKVAWLVRPIQSYQKHMEVILNRGVERLEEMVEMDIRDKDGGISVRKAELLLKVVTEVGNRVKGLAVQKIQKDERRIVGHVDARTPRSLPKEISEAQLREKLDKLRAQAGTGKSYIEGQVIESKVVETVEEDNDIVVVGAK